MSAAVDAVLEARRWQGATRAAGGRRGPRSGRDAVRHLRRRPATRSPRGLPREPTASTSSCLPAIPRRNSSNSWTSLAADTSGRSPRLGLRAAPHLPGRGASARRDHRSRGDRGAGRARLAGAAGPLRRLHRHVLAGERQVGRLRGGLRLLLAVALRRGGHADARDDGPRPDPRARAGGRGGGRAPLLHGHPGPGALEARLREDPRGRAARLRAHEPEALRVDRPHVGRAREGAQGGRRPARAPQRRDGRELLPGGVEHGPLRGPDPDGRRGARGRPRDLRGRHPQPRRVARAARGDGLPARRAQPHLGPDQPAEPAPRHEVRRPRADGPAGRPSSGSRSSG